MSQALQDEVQQIQGMLTRERLAVDLCDGKRTAFLTHIGAPPRLVPGPWIAQRQQVLALALANLSPGQRTSLAKAVVVEWGREFGVGRMVLSAIASGLPLGGSSLSMRPRTPGGDGSPHVLYTWALGARATPVEVDWLLLRAQPEWALDAGPRQIGVRGLETLAQLGGSVLILVPSAVAARQLADAVGGKLPLDSHPRFTPFLEHHEPNAALLLWPHDAIRASSLDKRRFSTVVLVGAPEPVRQEALRWASGRPGVELVDVACPGRVDRKALTRYWQACGRPKVLLRGDPEWAAQGQRWLEAIGATVAAHSEATQLGLF
ncbi:hypothetical protein G6O69_37540 [Pseudenhygromyxa sp. WMMC2535]|uniref:hypothetical protein n=1 Tax=Pseudenhygromyxa sp. WMMC2535 TaxID=2712867 RepID=UPI0015580B22|nr:hypothetical protein [Pseudenhygromyxa sp. WMMC2535]NVB38196.1 hypothetical protein [Pseudenhygromyxa sp. WMMC2535]NVB43577.1 hypothetical protein [Pseudenhygromyxa sp. WMMC2535]